jgi:hypothetical protein
MPFEPPFVSEVGSRLKRREPGTETMLTVVPDTLVVFTRCIPVGIGSGALTITYCIPYKRAREVVSMVGVKRFTPWLLRSSFLTGKPSK